MRVMLRPRQLTITRYKSRAHNLIDLARIPTNNGAESRSEWTKIQQMYENVHPNLALVLLFVRTEVECGKDLLLHKTKLLPRRKVHKSNFLNKGNDQININLWTVWNRCKSIVRTSVRPTQVKTRKHVLKFVSTTGVTNITVKSARPMLRNNSFEMI